MVRPELIVGDVLPQVRGEPWVFGAWFVAGQPCPHARIIHSVAPDGVVMTYEAVANGIVDSRLEANVLDNYEVWRPLCDQGTKQQALDWIRLRLGQGYGFAEVALALVKYRFGRTYRIGMDDPCNDDRRMFCSELIAMGFYRAGYDLVPDVCDEETMPWMLRNPARLSRIW